MARLIDDSERTFLSSEAVQREISKMREPPTMTLEERKPSMSDIHPSPAEFTDDEVAVDAVLRFFHYSHLPEKLQGRSKPFCDLARYLIDTTPRNAERSVALRKLLEAKDAAVRAAV